MQIREIDIANLKATEYNPRIELAPGSPDFEKLKNSIETFGNVEPIVWNERTGHIVGGHQRLAVLKHLGEKTTQVSVVNLDEREEKLLNVTLNKVKGQWDYEKLEEILSGFEFDEAKLSGFSAQEISLILARNDDLDTDDIPGGDAEQDIDFLGASWVIALKFDSSKLAQEWLDRQGLDAEARTGKRTTVVRMGEV